MSRRTSGGRACARGPAIGVVAICCGGAAACAGDPPDAPVIGVAGRDEPPAFHALDHQGGPGEEGARDPFEVLAERRDEGPPAIRARLHSCQKIQIAAVRNLLLGFGVALDAFGDPAPAGQLLRKGGGALGAANYDGRAGEALVWSTAGAAKLFDIFVRAAPEIIAHVAEVPQCRINGPGREMFTADGRCDDDAVSCLIGRPATPEHLAICDSAVRAASGTEIGRHIAVAALLSAAHLCE